MLGFGGLVHVPGWLLERSRFHIKFACVHRPRYSWPHMPSLLHLAQKFCFRSDLSPVGIKWTHIRRLCEERAHRFNLHDPRTQAAGCYMKYAGDRNASQNGCLGHVWVYHN